MPLPNKHSLPQSEANEGEGEGDASPQIASSFENGASRSGGSAQTAQGTRENTSSASDPAFPVEQAEETDLSSVEDAERMQIAQPSGKGWVRGDVATLTLNPAMGHAGLLEPQAAMRAERSRESGDFTDMDDAAVMLELKAGNMAAFDLLLQKYRRPIINFMFRMTHNQAIAEELAQEVFLRVYRSRETYRAEARFSTWLYRIATNLGVNHARDTRHERMASTIYLDEPNGETGSTPEVADSTPNIESTLLRDERMAAIREHVMALPERQRMGVLMHKYDGMDYKQIGEVLKLSESATKSLLFRAYQTLREKLKEFV